MAQSISKGDLQKAIAAQANIKQAQATAALNAVLDVISSTLAGGPGSKVIITNFGSFETKKREARTGVNPQNPEKKIKIPARNVVTFKPGKNLKETVN